QIDWQLPEKLVEKRTGSSWTKHLFADEHGSFFAEFNGWEEAILETELERTDVIAWLRNLPRKDWALCIPYEFGGMKPFYPDFVIIRRVSGGLVVDILEPHDDSRT